MGRDILTTTHLREQKLIARSMNCEIDHTVLAKWIQTTRRLTTVHDSQGNRAGDVDTIRECDRHHFGGFKDAEIIEDERIIEGVNNRHDRDDEAEKRARQEIDLTYRQMDAFGVSRVTGRLLA